VDPSTIAPRPGRIWLDAATGVQRIRWSGRANRQPGWRHRPPRCGSSALAESRERQGPRPLDRRTGRPVIEVERPKRPARRNGAKNDAIDVLRPVRRSRPLTTQPPDAEPDGMPRDDQLLRCGGDKAEPLTFGVGCCRDSANAAQTPTHASSALRSCLCLIRLSLPERDRGTVAALRRPSRPAESHRADVEDPRARRRSARAPWSR